MVRLKVCLQFEKTTFRSTNSEFSSPIIKISDGQASIWSLVVSETINLKNNSKWLSNFYLGMIFEGLCNILLSTKFIKVQK